MTKGEGVRLRNLMQPPLNTSMMGVLKGASDYYGLDLTAPTVYALSGHAFLINIHIRLCPSGPYCWKLEDAMPLIQNMGLRMTDLGFFGLEAKKEARTVVERKLREALDEAIACSLLDMDNQLVTGYDDTGFLLAQPWGSEVEFTPERLSFGTWKEFGDEIHANFYTIERSQPSDRRTAILESLDYAADMHRNPAEHSLDDYGVGPLAYDNWVGAIPMHGSDHGNWWNATVWSECRQMAAEFFSQIGNECKDVAQLCSRLSDEYLRIANNLEQVSEKTMAADEKIGLLRQTKDMEEMTVEGLGRLAAALRVLG